MKRQPMTRGQWAELIVGAVLPTLFVIPLVVVYLLYGYGMLLWFELRDPAGMGMGDVMGLVFGILVGTISVGAVFSQWCLILFGSEQISQRPFLRLLSIGTGILGLAVALYIVLESVLGEAKEFLIHCRSHTLDRFFGRVLHSSDWVPLVLIGPIAVGLRYLPQLLKGKNKNGNSGA